MMGVKRIVGYWAKLLDRFLDLDTANAQLRSQVRAQQINAIVRTTPAMMAGNICLGLVLVYFASLTPMAVMAAIWFAVLLMICGLAFRSWFKSQKAPAHKHASPRAIRRAACHAGCLGMLWGAAPALFFSYQFSELSAAMALGMTGSSARPASCWRRSRQQFWRF